MTVKMDYDDLQIATSYDTERINIKLAEAAKYTLLRRLAPAMQHEITGGFQPLRMVARVLDKRLKAAEPDLSALIKTSGFMGKLLLDASAVCTKVISWLSPDKNDKVQVSIGIADSIKLLGTDFALRGFIIDVSAPPSAVEVNAGALRQVFSISLIALTDLAAGPSRLSISFQEDDEEVLVMIRSESVEGDEMLTGPADYRSVDWDDVKALASAEEVGLKRSCNGLELVFQRRKP